MPLLAEFAERGEALNLDIIDSRFASWLRDVANQRIHGITGERPHARFLIEQAKLLPLPSVRLAQSVRELQRVAEPSTPLQRPLTVHDAVSTGVSV